MMNRQPKRFYVFGLFRIDVAERTLLSPQGVVLLTPKAFDTLLVLVENNRHVLSKEELMQKVWPDSYVEENNLAQNISVLRKALGEEQKFIETVPKRGYRFVADVREDLEDGAGLILRERTRTHIVVEEEAGEHEAALALRPEPKTSPPIIDLPPTAIKRDPLQ